MAAGNDAGGAVVAREVDERDHRRDLQLGMRPRDVAPHQLVAVQPLLVGPGSALQQVAEVQLVARARRQQDAIAQREQHRVAHHVGREGARDARHARDLLRLRPVERGHDRVEERLVRVGRVDRSLDLVVHPSHDVARQQPLDDHDTVPLDRLEDVVGLGVRHETADRRAHAAERTPLLLARSCSTSNVSGTATSLEPGGLRLLARVTRGARQLTPIPPKDRDGKGRRAVPQRPLARGVPRP